MDIYPFLDNKYTKTYFNIIHKAIQEKRQKSKPTSIEYVYYEKHHIIPKSLNGKDANFNFVLLTAREHYICHWLLTKMTIGHFKHKMLFALGRFVQKAPNQERHYSSKHYEISRKALSEAMSKREISPETLSKMSKTWFQNLPDETIKKIRNNSKNSMKKFKGKTFNERFGLEKARLIKEKMSKGNKGKEVSKETREKLRKINLGKKLSNKTRTKMSISKKGENNGMYGKTHTKESRLKIADRIYNTKAEKNVNAKKWKLVDPINNVFYLHGNLQGFCNTHNLKVWTIANSAKTGKKISKGVCSGWQAFYV